MLGKNVDLLKKVVLTSLFTALCFACTYIQIKMPAGDLVHLGNFVCILSALLFGGVIGGITGSVGMGLYDLINYSSKPTTIVRTLILKFIIGFVAGALFRVLIKRDKKYAKYLYIMAGTFAVLFIGSLMVQIFGDKIDGFGKSFTIDIFGKSKKITVSGLIPIFSSIFSLLLFVAGLYSNKLSKVQNAVFISVSFAIIVNIIGEFILRYLLEGLFLSDFKTSLVVATSKIPGSTITGFVTVLLVVAIYEPIAKGINTVMGNNLEEDDIN